MDIIKAIVVVLSIVLVGQTCYVSSTGKGSPATDDKKPNGRRKVKTYGGGDNGSLNEVQPGNQQCQLEINCKGTGHEAVPITLPIAGPPGIKGEMGPRGLKGEPGTPGIPGVPGSPPAKPRRSAFFVGLRKNIGPFTQNTDIRFDHVMTNIGNDYDPESGKFTAPINGTYEFRATISAQGGNRAAAMMVKNGYMVVTIWAESIPTWGTASNSAILRMSTGEQVWLVLLHRASHLHGYMYTTFGGHLVFEED